MVVLLRVMTQCMSFTTNNNNNNNHNHKTTTHFGNQTIPSVEKQAKVAQVFHQVAEKYDVMNDFMSAGVHRLWKDEMVSMIQPLYIDSHSTTMTPNTTKVEADTDGAEEDHSSVAVRILDVAGGTGDIAFRLANQLQKELPTTAQGEIIVCDINSSMLQVGQERANEKGKIGNNVRLQWVEGNAEDLPFESNSFDLYTIAFGIRNVTHVDKALSEAYRVLRKGGRFVCLEFSHIDNPILGSVYDAFSFNVIPVLGEIVANDRASYQYLVESIRKFPPQKEFKSMIESAGFQRVHYTNFTAGVAAFHSGFKLD